MTAMVTIRLIHWKGEEAEERAEKLRSTGYTVDATVPAGPESFRALTQDPPAAVVIDLSRTPSNGRDVALFLRKTKSTRHIPIVFVEGDTEKVERIRKLLPDAVYSTWRAIRGSGGRLPTEGCGSV